MGSLSRQLCWPKYLPYLFCPLSLRLALMCVGSALTWWWTSETFFPLPLGDGVTYDCNSKLPGRLKWKRKENFFFFYQPLFLAKLIEFGDSWESLQICLSVTCAAEMLHCLPSSPHKYSACVQVEKGWIHLYHKCTKQTGLYRKISKWLPLQTLV